MARWQAISPRLSFEVRLIERLARKGILRYLKSTDQPTFTASASLRWIFLVPILFGLGVPILVQEET